MSATCSSNIKNNYGHSRTTNTDTNLQPYSVHSPPSPLPPPPSTSTPACVCGGGGVCVATNIVIDQ